MAIVSSWLPNPAKKPKTVAATDPVQDFFGRTPQAAELLKPISLPKVPGADPFIFNAFQDYAGLRDRIQGDLSKYRAGMEGTQPDVTRYANQDIGELSRIFDATGYESDLAGIRRTRTAAMDKLNDTILGDLRRALSLGSRGGTAGTGLGSYLTRQAAAEAGKIRASAAVDDATQQRSDLATLLAARSGSIGKRQSVVDSLVARLLAPTDKDLGAQSGLSTQLQQVLSSALANLVSAYAG